MPWAAELKEKQGHDHSVELVSSGDQEDTTFVFQILKGLS